MSHQKAYGRGVARQNPSAREQPRKVVDQRLKHQKQIWQRVDGNLKKMRFDRSPFVPVTFEQYVEHATELCSVIDDLYNPQREDMKPVVLDLEAVRHCGLESMLSPEALRERGIKLCETTVWGRLWQPTRDHPAANWPTEQELKEEGDERYTSGFGRFLPIPRVPGNAHINWKQKPFLRPYELDQVRPVPKKYNEIPLPYDHEVHEPVVDENGVYMDDWMESGRVAYATDRCFRSRGLEARNKEWESQYFGRSRQVSEPILGARPHAPIINNGSNGSSSQFSNSATTLLNRAPIVIQKRAWAGNSRSEAMMQEFFGPVIGNTPPVAYATPVATPSRSGTGRGIVGEGNGKIISPPETFPSISPYARGSSYSYPHVSREEEFMSPTKQRFEDGSFLSANPWRQITYGRNSFSRRDTITEETNETISEVSFDPNAGEVLPHSSPRAKLNFGPIQRPNKQAISPRSRSISPKSPETVIGSRIQHNSQASSHRNAQAPVTEFDAFQLSN